MRIDIDKWLATSGQVRTDDLDWEHAAQVGLSPDEVFVLTYFADVEGQTIVYLRDLLSTPSAMEQDNIAFLSMWNYEEYFHGQSLGRLLEICGYPLGGERIRKVRATARVQEAIEAIGSRLLGWFFRDDFAAVHFAWGAVQELTTLKGYERIVATTKNPVLAELSRRIAKQERRHFAYYYNQAKQRLQKSARARWLTRRVLSGFWTPVGAGVKADDEVASLFARLFPGEKGHALASTVDNRIAKLPGLEGLSVMSAFFAEKQPSLAA